MNERSRRPGEAPARVFLVDGTALLYRAHFALLRNPLVTSRGEPVGAVFGFANALFQLLRQQQPEHLGVAFDLGGPTVRHGRYAGYKAQRPPMPDELSTQQPRARQLVRAMGLPVIEQEGIEADDLIGALAVRAVARGLQAVIVSGDKDFMQLIQPGIRQWIPPLAGSEAQWIDAEQVVAKWGVGPERMVDLLGLMGDASDNIPGVRGVGPKTAAQLIQQYGTIEGVYLHLDDLGKRAIRAKLEADRENAFLSRELVRIDTGLEPPCDLEQLRVGPFAARPELVELLRELEFRRLLESLGPAAETSWQADYRVVRSLPELDDLLAAWRRSGEPLVLDTETDSLDARTARPVGITLGWNPGEAWYVPVGHRDGENLDPAEVAARLRPALADPSAEVAGQNLKYDLHVLAGLGVEAAGPLRDTLLAAYLIDPEGKHGLDALSQDHLRHRMIPITDLIGTGRNQITMDRVPIERVAEYSGEDVDATCRLLPILEGQLRTLGLQDLWRDLECPLLRVLLRMEQAGIRVDTALLGLLARGLEADLERLTAEIHRAAETEFNVNSPPQLAAVLFERLKLPAGRRTRTGLSTDQEVLEELAELHPVPRLVLEHRVLSKLKGTYVDALPKLVDPRTGRIHAAFHQHVAATGRLSSSDPNLQNIPIRTERGREIRRAFVAEEGCLLLSADYSQIELRILAHLSGEPALLESFARGEDIHARTAAEVFGLAEDQVDSTHRRYAKAVNFGIMYGISAFGLSQNLGIEREEAAAYIERYFERLPRVKTFIEQTIESAKRQGYVATVFGRRRPIPELASGNFQERSLGERLAVNSVIQGSAADIIKVAMVGCHRRLSQGFPGSRLVLQVHDELVFEVPEGEKKDLMALVKREMEGVMKLRVPLKVEIHAGRNWDEAH